MNVMATIHQISSHLECSICLALFNQPKILTCSHTFCKDCLERIFRTQTNKHTISCPLCRAETSIPNGDMGKLQTNVPLSSLVDEAKTQSPTCTVCDTDEKPPAESYCQDCGESMCASCEKGHSSWEPFSCHTVVAMNEVLSGKVPQRRRRKCKEHPNDDEDCFCPGCREYVCFKCGMLEHSQEGHGMVKASKHERRLMENIKELQKRANSKKTIIEEHVKFIETQHKEISDMMRKLNDDIDKTYEENIQLLSARRETLKGEVRQLSKTFEEELHVMAQKSHRTIKHMNAAEELVANVMNVPLEKDALITHETLCENLESILGYYPNDQSPRNVKERAQKISFRKHVSVNKPCLGELGGHTWDVKINVGLLVTCCNCITRSPDDEMAVAGDLGIQFYSRDGKLHNTLLRDQHVGAIAFLSDGRSVVHGGDEISLYTQEWEKLDIEFESSYSERWDFGGLCTDASDDIYVGFKWLELIEVFTPQGGKAIREIVCDGYSTWRLFSFQTPGNLLLANSENVVCIDSKGTEKNILQKENRLPVPAVCRDDSVIVAWVTELENLISIDRYTSDFEHLQNLVSDFEVSELRSENDYPVLYLQEFESGDIALCNSDRLYIFHTS